MTDADERPPNVTHLPGCGWETGLFCTCGADPGRSFSESIRRGLEQASRGETVRRDDWLEGDKQEFILDRIAEDEKRAGRALAGAAVRGWGDWVVQALAECEAKRRIIFNLTKLAARQSGEEWSAADSALIDTLREFAAVYEDHSDYPKEWKP